jgi:hypothetical protein
VEPFYLRFVVFSDVDAATKGGVTESGLLLWLPNIPLSNNSRDLTAERPHGQAFSRDAL